MKNRRTNIGVGRRSHIAVLVLFLCLFGTLLISSLATPVAGQSAPIARFRVVNDELIEGEVVKFDASGSIGYELTFSWEFGDGEEGEGEVVDHIYEDWGDYTITLIVQDSEGNFDIAAKTIKVQQDSEMPEWMGWFFIGFMGVYCLIMVFVLLAMVVIWIINIVILVKLHKKMKNTSEKYGDPESLKTYRTILLIVGIIGMVMFNFVVFTIIGQLVIYLIFQNKVDSEYKKHWKKKKHPPKDRAVPKGERPE